MNLPHRVDRKYDELLLDVPQRLATRHHRPASSAAKKRVMWPSTLRVLQVRRCPYSLKRCDLSSSTQRATLRIVSVNDVYELHHLPRLRSLIDHRAAEGSVTITALCGDFVSPSILSGMDGGAGMIAVLNQLPISHVCFGNHEADIQLDSIVERTCEFAGCWLNSNMPSFPLPATGDQPSSVRPFDLIDCETAAGQPIRVGLIGLLTSESGVFRKNRFRGLEIEDTLEAAARWSGLLRSQHGADVIVALTHQSLAVDERLAASGHVDLVLGGHEHEVIERWSESGVPVIKAGSDAQTAAVVDLHLERLPSSEGGAEAPNGSESRVAVDVDVRFEDVSSYEPETQLAAAVNAQLHVLRALEEEVVCSVADLGGAAEHFGEFTSVGTRFQQTSVGAALTAACKEVLQVPIPTLAWLGLAWLGSTRLGEPAASAHRWMWRSSTAARSRVTVPTRVASSAISTLRASCHSLPRWL